MPRIAHFGTRSRHPRPALTIKKPLTLRKSSAAAGTPVPSTASPSPKRAGAAPVPLGPSTPSLEALTSFPAMGLEQQVADMGRDQISGPASTQIGVSPSQVVEVVNANMSVWTRSGARLGTQDLSLLFSLPSGFVFADPNIVFDAGSGRWLLSGLSYNASFDSNVYIAASSTSDATGAWVVYTLASTANGVLMDQPRLGTGTDVVVMAWDDFATPCSPACTFNGDEMYAVDKSELIAGTTPLDRATTPGPDMSRFGLMPAREQSGSGTEYFVWNNSDAASLITQTTPGPTLGVIAVNGLFDPTTHTNTISFTEQWLSSITTGTHAPPNAQQPGGGPLLETGDDRVASAVWQNSTLWTAANETCPSAAGSGCIRLLQLDTTSGTVTASEIGGAGDYVFDPGLAVDNAGRVVVSYLESSSSIALRAVAVMPASGAPAVVFGPGSQGLNMGLCGLSPWKATAGAAIDPSNGADVWVAGAFGANATDLCDWHSAIARLTLSAPAISSFSPATVSQAGGTVVDIKGTDFTPGSTVQFPSGTGTNVTVISPEELTAVAPAAGSPATGSISVTTASGTASSAATISTEPYQFSSMPIAPNRTLGAGAKTTVSLTPQGATPAYLSFVGSGSACVVVAGVCSLTLTATPQLSPVVGTTTIQYTSPSSLSTSGSDQITAQNAAPSPSALLSDSYSFGPMVSTVLFAGTPSIAAEGDLVAQMDTHVTLTAFDASHNPVPNAAVALTFAQAAGGGSASVDNVLLTGSAQWFTTDANGKIDVTYSTPTTLPLAGGTDTINAAVGSAADHDSYVLPPVTTFYFAEGFTAAGFTEILSLLMPNENGTVLIDYYTKTAHGQGIAFLDQGTVETVDVNGTVGPNQEVSMKVTMPGPGVAERTIHFSFGSWHGTTDIVGTTGPSTVWNFAEGSTLAAFNEYLTLQNPNNSAVTVDLNYFRSDGVFAPSKALNLPANSRTTVEVFSGGNVAPGATCVASGAGANCGVGRGIGGVSTQIVSRTLPIIAERPFYVNNFSFGFGAIRDGHDAFGATAAATQWNFAEGTTLAGFNEYLTLQNASPTDAHVQLHYFTDTPGVNPVKSLVVPHTSRVTVEVFSGDRNNNASCSAASGGNCGVGLGIGGVSTQVTSDVAIVAERPMYIVHNFGTGTVAGAHDVVGATAVGQLFGFAAASTATGESDFLTIQNSGASVANITATYYTGSGPLVRNFPVAAGSRHTVQVFLATEGPGPGYAPLGIVIQSDKPVLVEKPTYGSTTGAYGATDTLGYAPPGF